MYNLVFLDAKTVGRDLDLMKFNNLANVKIYDFSDPNEVPERISDADIVVVNKVPMNESTLANSSKLKLICVTATGVDNLDREYLDKRGIEWRNVAGYSTECVAQHTFSLFFYLWEHLSYYDGYVKNGGYVGDKSFSHFEKIFHEIYGKKWGVIGLGAIGRRVSEIARCFGFEVQYYSTSGKNHSNDVKEVDLNTLLFSSDVVSVHCPLSEKTRNLINSDTLKKMKKEAILLNLARGPVVDEEALTDALNDGTIAAAGLDVLSKEPMSADNPLFAIKDSDKLLITPHIGWAAKETRIRLMDTIYGQIEDFLARL